MTRKTELPYYTAQGCSGNTAMEKLQRKLCEGEYDTVNYTLVFASDFIQITQRGEVLDMHKHVELVTVGIACTSPILPLPDVMLLAGPAPDSEDLELTRLLPLRCVRLSVHNREEQQLHLKLTNGCSYYLQLYPHLEGQDDLFTYWEKLIYFLRPPVDSNRRTYAIPAEGMTCRPLLDEEDKTHAGVEEIQGGDLDKVSIRSLPEDTDVTGVSSAAFAGGEALCHNSRKPTIVQAVSIKGWVITRAKLEDLAKESGTGAAAAKAGGLAGALSLSATRSINAATTGGAIMGERGSKSHLAVTSAGKMSPESMKVAVAEAASRSLESMSTASTSISRKEDIAKALVRLRKEPTINDVREAEAHADTGALAWTLPRERQKIKETAQQKAPEGNTAANREREREQTAKDRAGSRSSSHHRTGGRRKTAGKKGVQKSASRRSAPEEKEKGTRSWTSLVLSHLRSLRQ